MASGCVSTGSPTFCKDIMPVRSLPLTTGIQVLTHTTARGFFNAAWLALSKRESAANIIFPCALQILSLEGTIQAVLGDAETQLSTSQLDIQVQSNSPRLSPNVSGEGSSNSYLWFTCWSGYEERRPCLDIILSCTVGASGPQPIFLWSGLPPSQTTQEHLDPRIAMLAKKLFAIVPVTRVFSVFGPVALTKTFSRHWSNITGMTQIMKPLYAAKLLYATRETLTKSSTLPSGDTIRPGSPDDISAIGGLCKAFSETTIYYPLSPEEAMREATELVFNHQVWVYETEGGQIATITAVARVSPNVATITKVYTCITRRKGGYAERLVREVVREMLYSLEKQRVVLYVGNGNAAANVYSRVGFRGLQEEDGTEEVEEWLEIGFRGTCRGHW